MAVLAHEALRCAGIDLHIALADVVGVESCEHYYIMIDGEPCEPKYIGIYLRVISATTTRCGSTTTPTSSDDGNDLMPAVALIIDAACEHAGCAGA